MYRVATQLKRQKLSVVILTCALSNTEATKLFDLGFYQLVGEATHLKGGHLDHVYSNHDPKKFKNEILMYSPYYTSLDHDAICLTLRPVVSKTEVRHIHKFSFFGMKLVLFLRILSQEEIVKDDDATI